MCGFVTFLGVWGTKYLAYGRKICDSVCKSSYPTISTLKIVKTLTSLYFEWEPWCWSQVFSKLLARSRLLPLYNTSTLWSKSAVICIFLIVFRYLLLITLCSTFWITNLFTVLKTSKQKFRSISLQFALTNILANIVSKSVDQVMSIESFSFC